MENMLSRTKLLIGEEKVKALKSSSVAVFGIGGVGSAAVEAVCRAGIGEIHLIDADVFSVSNLNRQIFATLNNIGQKKVDVAENRILSINPECKVYKYPVFFLPENSDSIDFSRFNYVIDAVDTVTAKIEIAKKCKEFSVSLISVMGTGNRLDADFKVTDIYNTSGCSLARVMRGLCRKNNIDELKVVYSEDAPVTPVGPAAKQSGNTRRDVPGSISFVPPVAGYIAAGEAIKYLIKGKAEK